MILLIKEFETFPAFSFQVVTEMFRQRLRGGHKVGAPNSVTRSFHSQTGSAQQTVRNKSIF